MTPGVAARDDLRQAHVKTSPAREPPFIMAGSSIRGCCGRREHQCAGSPAHSRTGTDHAQTAIGPHTPYGPEPALADDLLWSDELLHSQGRSDSLRRVERDFRT